MPSTTCDQMALPSIDAHRRGRSGWSGKTTVLGGFRKAGANIQSMTRWRKGSSLLSPAGYLISASEHSVQCGPCHLR
jgi:hypothetical protein